MADTVQVVLPLPVEQAYTYRVPDEMKGEAQVGSRVLVSFGPRRLTGLVVRKGGKKPEGVDRLKPVLDVLDEQPAFTDEMLRLTRWIADYYVCYWGEVVKAALPSGTSRKSKRRLKRTEQAVENEKSERARAVLRYLERHEEVTLKGLRQEVDQVPLALLRRLERKGLLEIEKALSRPRVNVKYEKHLRFAPPFRHDGAASDLKAQLRGHKQRAVIEVLAGLAAEGEKTPRQSEVKARAEASSSTVKSLVKKGMIEVVEKEVIRTPMGVAAVEDEEPPQYTYHPSQQAALDEVAASVEAGGFETFLLHGVTGSGKTEVYITALKRVLEKGKTGIILVPEIALTPQTVRRFRAHFGDRIAVLHSQMSLGERYDAWRHLRHGRFDVVIGPRSAVLAPLSNLGLIVVDEEHETSYKQFDPSPRYHARDVAVMRAHMNDAVCILGSATPSLESMMNTRRGKYSLLSMPDRVPVPGREAAPLPEVEIVDLTKERKKHRLDGVLSVPLQEAIQQRLAKSEQVILLQNRRGYAPLIECASCGWSPVCGSCSVTMTYHKPRRHLRCHYCGQARRLPDVCPRCNEDELSRIGTGTQRVVEELNDRFPEAVTLRMDRDSTNRKNAHHELLGQFGRGEADILVGTQMVAKGLDFGRVTLVGVVNADAGLLLPDFRAEEHTFQLLTQVAGRAGRSELGGEVILQTRNPDNKVLHYALAHDYDGFAEQALDERRALSYPPFGRIVGVEFRGEKKQTVEKIARQWTAGLRRHAGDIDVLGPEPALVARIKRKYRYHTILKAPRSQPTGRLQHILGAASENYGQPPKGYRIAMDVDAVSLF